MISVLPIGIVINNKHFTCGMKDRVGTDRDADSLTKLFTHLGFYTNRYDDLKGKKMREILEVRAFLMLPRAVTNYINYI